MAEPGRITLCALGDVFINAEDPKAAFKRLEAPLAAADVDAALAGFGRAIDRLVSDAKH